MTRLYINDIVKFDFEIAHATTSDTNADSVSLTICSDGSLTPEPALAMTNSNSTCALYAPFSGNVVNLGRSFIQRCIGVSRSTENLVKDSILLVIQQSLFAVRRSLDPLLYALATQVNF